MGYAMKICNGCGIEKPFECFSIVKAGKGDRNNLASRCKECRAARNTIWHRENKARSLENHRKWIRDNPDKVKAYSKKWMAENPVRHADGYKRWNAENQPRKTANAARKRAAQLKATPPWITPIHRAQIQQFYDVARARKVQTGIIHHVDHIHPLQGARASGLHVPWNLQILTAAENISKKNKMEQV